MSILSKKNQNISTVATVWEMGVDIQSASTTVLQESAQATWAPWQRSGEVGCDLTAQGGDGLRIMPFCPYG